MATVMIIPAKKQMGNTIKKPEEKKGSMQNVVGCPDVVNS